MKEDDFDCRSFLNCILQEKSIPYLDLMNHEYFGFADSVAYLGTTSEASFLKGRDGQRSAKV